ncbi:MAG: ABC transporter ATP-binding protein/permease [Actinomycetota bacterium]|nr:ABC transporter ATP-binding protein/permease [Actinomycetota bacterium]
MSAAARREAVRRLLWSSLHGRGPELRRLAAWSLLEALPAFLSGRLIAEAIDDGFLAGETAVGFAWLGALAASALVGAWATRQTFLRLAEVVEPFRDDLATLAVHGALRRSTAVGAMTHTAGVARLSQQVEIVRESYASVLFVVQGFLVSAVGALLGLLTLVPAVLVFVVPPLIIGLGLFLVALPGMAARQRASILADERIAESASTVTGGLRDVVACGAEERVAGTVGEHIEAQADATREIARFTAVRTIAVALGGLLPIVLILAAGPWLLRHGATVGAILGALTYVSQGVQPALQTLVSGIGNTGLWLFVTLGRIVEETEPPAVGDRPVAHGGPSRGPQGHDVELRDVTFGYGRASEPVISGLDLVVPEGDHLAVVGPSGVGKSTLASLIAGLLEPQMGEVRVGGVPIERVERELAAQQRVLIPQEAYVFEGTLRENLTYLSLDATTAQLDDAVERLGMRALVTRLGGYGAELDRAALSAGERQLVTLARAYVAPARLMILDEATCHLDPAAEARVERAFADRGGSLLVIAHRISSALRAQHVLVLDGGQALVGGHDELLTHSALYRDLVGHWEGSSPVGAAAPINGAPAAPYGVVARIGCALGKLASELVRGR